MTPRGHSNVHTIQIPPEQQAKIAKLNEEFKQTYEARRTGKITFEEYQEAYMNMVCEYMKIRNPELDTETAHTGVTK
jgi:hypothetical protein